MKALLFLPECTWILIMVGIGLALTLQIITRKTAFSVLGSIVLMALLGPFVDSLFDALPGWVSVLILIALGFSLINFVLGACFGKHTASHLWALLLHDVILIPFRLVGLLFRRR
jgi:hypothetical protein